MEINKIIEKYNYWVEFSELKVDPKLWVITSTIISIVLAVIGIFLTSIMDVVTLLPYAISIATFILLIGFPYMKTTALINKIESDFSDALKQMADTLKAGDTYESALREVVRANYGKLSQEMDYALRNLQEGENIQTSLGRLGERIDSRLIQRTIIIILDAIKSGGGLADLLEDIADDVKEFYRIKEQRKVSTTMQFLFMSVAGGIVAPLIFGEVTAITQTFSLISAQVTQVTTNNTNNFIMLIIQVYLIVEVVATSIIMSVIREGKVNKSIIYIPILLLIGFLFYYASFFGASMMMSGII